MVISPYYVSTSLPLNIHQSASKTKKERPRPLFFIVRLIGVLLIIEMGKENDLLAHFFCLRYSTSHLRGKPIPPISAGRLLGADQHIRMFLAQSSPNLLTNPYETDRLELPPKGSKPVSNMFPYYSTFVTLIPGTFLLTYCTKLSVLSLPHWLQI